MPSKWSEVVTYKTQSQTISPQQMLFSLWFIVLQVSGEMLTNPPNVYFSRVLKRSRATMLEIVERNPSLCASCSEEFEILSRYEHLRAATSSCLLSLQRVLWCVKNCEEQNRANALRTSQKHNRHFASLCNLARILSFRRAGRSRERLGNPWDISIWYNLMMHYSPGFSAVCLPLPFSWKNMPPYDYGF